SMPIGSYMVMVVESSPAAALIAGFQRSMAFGSRSDSTRACGRTAGAAGSVLRVMSYSRSGRFEQRHRYQRVSHHWPVRVSGLERLGGQLDSLVDGFSVAI